MYLVVVLCLERLSAKSCRSCGQWSLYAKVPVKCCIVQRAPGIQVKIIMLPWGVVVRVKYKCKYVCVMKHCVRKKFIRPLH